jgi:activator of HSP90 ATPase
MIAPAAAALPAAATAAPVTTTAATAHAAAAHVTAATAVPAAAVPVHRLCLLDHARISLWRRSGVREPGQADGRKAKRAGDCARANNLLEDHAIPL